MFPVDQTGIVPVQPSQIREVAARSVGPCAVVADLSWDHGEAVVVELQTASGQRLIGKAHRQAGKFAAECIAYERWVPALGRHAPRLIVADPECQVLILTKLDAAALAERPDVDMLDVHRQAGALLARFHGSEPAVLIEGHARLQRERLAAWVDRAAANVLSSEDVSLVDRQLAALDTLPDPAGVPCHRDWQPRNWLVDDGGVVHAIDFEHARVAPWYEDLQRLWWNEWLDAPACADAFFDGYGRTLDGDELSAFTATSALGHLTTIVWAHEHADDDFGAHARRCLARIRERPAGEPGGGPRSSPRA